MSPSASEIQELVRDYVAGEVACELTAGVGSRVGCLTPLEYPDGDQITVWVEDYAGRLVVTDHGDALSNLLMHPPQDQRALTEQVTGMCRPFGITYERGALATEANASEIGEAVWRVATAAQMVAQASHLFRPRRRQHFENPFVAEVDHTLRGRQLPIERERKLEGLSGHTHIATFFLPRGEAVLEPISAAPHWNQVSTVYTKFGDLSRANGFRLYSLIDDRQGPLSEDLARMLVQVSAVVQWTRRDEWLSNVS